MTTPIRPHHSSSRRSRFVAAVTGITITTALVASIGPDASAKSKSSKMTTHTKKSTKATKATKDIVDTAVATGSFSTLAKALTAAGLVDTLKGPGPFTVFAPTDAAFAALPPADLNALLADKAALTKVLTYHVVSGQVPAAQVVKLNGKSVPTVNGASLTIGVAGSKVTLNGDTNVTATDVKATNGVIHVIDKVLIPSGFTIPDPTLIGLARSAGTFTTLLKAVDAAGLTATLKGAGPFTLLAPTDAAFAKLPAGTVESLLKPENKATLTKILTSHVIGATALSSDVAKLTQITTLSGQKWPVTVSGSKVMIGSTTVTAVDLKASNGVAHVIDTVLVPAE